jgi:hypothetical protein
MRQRILITNFELNPSAVAAAALQIYFFNPWGFSKQGIVDQIQEVLEQLPRHEELEILFCVRNRFFGNRAKIAFEKTQQYFNYQRVSQITEDELTLLLNQTSV